MNDEYVILVSPWYNIDWETYEAVRTDHLRDGAHDRIDTRAALSDRNLQFTNDVHQE